MKLTKDSIRFNLLRIPCFFKQLYIYNFSVALGTFIFPFNIFFCNYKKYIAVYKHKAILMYLKKKYKHILMNYTDKTDIPESKIEKDSVIWVCWWDGEEAMPSLVKSCFSSIKKNAGQHPVKLITKYNYNDYISIPEFIINKVNTGIMTITHFSNIIRANLLYEYGGIWLDTTILILKEISLDNLPFFTLKAPAKKSTSITLDLFAGLSSNFTHFNFKSKSLKEISRWSGFLLAGSKHSPIFKYMIEILYAYWKDHDDQIDYLLYDYTIALGYDNIPYIKKIIDNVETSKKEKYELEYRLNNEYNKVDFQQLYITTFHKLTWKKKFNIYTNNNKLTNYGYIINNKEFLWQQLQ